ncbi:succinate dehydrogenase assembly factor 2 [Alphaproteobacteria bacterium]|nr:succinate dehydrogenase assembly factor 2 [Alphaproteobacteria bacterium]
MNNKIINLKKLLVYRLSYSGTKETDILYKKIILNKLDLLKKNEMELLSDLLINISDIEFFNYLTNKSIPPKKYSKIINKLINE